MPERNQTVLDFLLTRRSRPAKTLTGPVPDRDEVRMLLSIAARTPDHKKLEPWRFIVLEKAALQRLAAMVPAGGEALGIAPDKVEKMVRQFADADLAIAVVVSPVDNDAVPELEQVLSAGAACYGLLSAALAAGWGANWLSGWASLDRPFVETGLGLDGHETVAGFIHIGTETVTPSDRPRPDLDRITRWMAE